MYPFLKDYQVKQYIIKNLTYNNFIFLAVLLIIAHMLGEAYLSPVGQLISVGVSFFFGIYMCGKSKKTLKRTRLESCLIYAKYAVSKKFMQGGEHELKRKANRNKTKIIRKKNNK